MSAVAITGATGAHGWYAYTSGCKRRGEKAVETNVEETNDNPIPSVSNALDLALSHVW
jgi:hypothetical protein